ncbi:hypothetical protein [Prescottella agglutinans]|uniref:Nuclear transport factor 2 family protein n=1 Tax=Prescottella agglutinans TaxID=1644129 RepID=A0ABT6M6D9_9NOCA|nr:hypothetical protein [Prescottella agglutinans]MDH6279321.1 hypothetical protein [Prescottella agglutinans]
MKRTVLIAAVVVAVASLTACGGSEDSSGQFSVLTTTSSANAPSTAVSSSASGVATSVQSEAEVRGEVTAAADRAAIYLNTIDSRNMAQVLRNNETVLTGSVLESMRAQWDQITADAVRLGKVEIPLEGNFVQVDALNVGAGTAQVTVHFSLESSRPGSLVTVFDHSIKLWMRKVQGAWKVEKFERIGEPRKVGTRPTTLAVQPSPVPTSRPLPTAQPVATTYAENCKQMMEFLDEVDRWNKAAGESWDRAQYVEEIITYMSQQPKWNSTPEKERGTAVRAFRAAGQGKC